MRGRAKLELTVQAARRALRPHANYRCLHRWARSALLRDAVLTLRFVSRQEARRLNRSFRGGDYAGNVLTFNYGTHSCDDCGEPIRADIVICMPVVAKQAAAQHKSIEHHLAHMVTHGVLHAQGWDHVGRDQAARMEALEARLLRRWRITNPY